MFTYGSTAFAKVFDLIKLNNLNNFQVRVKTIQLSSSSAFLLKCYYFRNPTTPNPTGIQATLMDSFGFVRLTSNILTFPTLLEDSPNIYDNTMDKKIATFGGGTILTFYLQAAQVSIGRSSRILIVFPFYFSTQLNKDNLISCSDAYSELYCFQKSPRTLEIRYFNHLYPAKSLITLTISGIE